MPQASQHLEEVSSKESKNQGANTVLQLESKAQDAVLELGSDTISRKDIAEKIFTRLHRMYKKDQLTQKFSSLESLKKYNRQDNTERF